MKVSVIIPSYSDTSKLRICLDALAAQDASREDFEVIVADNHDQPTIDKSSFAGLENLVVIHEPRGGSYAARNKAIAFATGKVLLFTDADCIPEPRWVSRAIALGDQSIVGGQVELILGSSPCGLEQYERVFYFNQSSYIERDGYAVTANLLVSKHTMEELGVFDASLRSGGDRVWGQKATAAGHKIVFDSELVVRHPTRSELGEFLKRRVRVMSGNLYLFHREVGLTWEYAWNKIVFIGSMKNFRAWTADWSYFDQLSASEQRRIKRLHRLFTLYDIWIILKCKFSFKSMKKMTLIDRN